MSRFEPVDRSELPETYDIIEERREKLDADVDSDFWRDQPTVRTFSINPELGAEHVHVNTTMWSETGLSPAERECVILTIARELDSAYEWHDHVIAALERTELAKSDVVNISTRNVEQFDSPKRELIRYIAEYVNEQGSISDETHAALAEHYDEQTLIGIAMLAGFYVSLSYEIEALDLDLKDGFVGWEAENYSTSD